MFRCEECGRSFCVLNPTEMQEWYYGHDCEPIDGDPDLVTPAGSP